MSVVKALRFPVSVHWEGGRLTHAFAAGKDELQIATPPEFRGGVDGVWSPEDLLVAATASCYAVTVAAIAERREVPIHELHVSGTGHVSRRDDGRFGFVAIELDAEISTPARSVRAAEAVAELAEEKCLVSRALDVPLHVAVNVRPSVPEHHFLGAGFAS
jgi:peroxiredoxin-like protein